MRAEHGSHWAELSEAPFTWGQKNRIRDAAAKEGFYGSFAVALATSRVTAWSETGDPTDPKAWEPVDANFGDVVFRAALDLWRAAPDPNATAPPSSDSPAAAASGAPSPAHATPSSCPGP